MTFDELLDFLERKMSMSHIYQPLLIRSLIEAGGQATLRQLAQAFLLADESQIQFYEKRIKEMPLRVLARHGVVDRNGDLVSLRTKPLSFVEKARVKMLCEQRLQEYIQKRGLAIWEHRFLDTDPVGGSLRNRVLMDAGRRCALCGITARERPLDVDHIKPRSRGGSTVYENLQVLCAKCNRAKRDQDETDVRMDPRARPEPDCPFCSAEVSSRYIDEQGSVLAIEDAHPVTPVHLLVIPRRHLADWFEMSELERRDAHDLLRRQQKRIKEDDRTVTAFNVGANSGAAAGQTVMHAHIHLIPRRQGDNPDPRGGVRAVIPGRASY